MSYLYDHLEVDRLPRKKKKSWLGRLTNKSKLRKLLASVVVIEPNNGRDSAEVLPYHFCPMCGCRGCRWTGNRAAYPERWDSGYCLRCGFHVWESDNSPYYHALEMKEFDYIIN